MQTFFEFLNTNPFILLFFTIGIAVAIGSVRVHGYGLGVTGAAIVLGCALSMWGSTHGVKLGIDGFAKSIFFYLFIYGFGLRVGPSFLACFKKDGFKVTILAIVSSGLSLILVVLAAKVSELPAGVAAGILAGSQSMPAALATAEMAAAQNPGKGSTAESISAMIALGYAITCVWGSVGLVFITKHLPRWWRVDVKAAVSDFAITLGVTNLTKSGLAGYRLPALRAHVLENSFVIGQSLGHFWQKHPQFRILNVVRDGNPIELSPEMLLEAGDVLAIAGGSNDLTGDLALIGPEVSDPKALNIPIDYAEILVTKEDCAGRPLRAFRSEDFAGQIQIIRMERGGVPMPVGADIELKRFDVLFVAGLKTAIGKLTAMIGKAARLSTATDLATICLGIVLGLLIGHIRVPMGSITLGLGNAGGLLIAGFVVSSVLSRTRFFGHMPSATRNVLEEVGVVAFLAIVGINAGSVLLPLLGSNLGGSIFVVGFIATTVPPIVTWAVGRHLFKMNPAVLIGSVGGASSNTAAIREVSREVDSNVPWAGFPVAYAMSGVLLAAFGYWVMAL